ncbi:MAG TPA: YidC/Oxa1 family insertase periplasmic-domain containing protein [Spirochaetota bacterium]|nr:YidC/Oxa1 family insertase periplasmic-domain containing protein [Spirochaetota bacterium]HPP03448.1 YidC/Oxa1 family insertase periplasmic-domain containing protein [Spirochaetota bacterium]
MDENTKRTLIFMIIFSILFMVINIYFYMTTPKKEAVTENTIKEKEVEDKEIKTIKKIDKFIIINKKEYKENIFYENENLKIEFDQNDALVKSVFIKKYSNTDLINSTNNFGSLKLKFGSWKNGIELKDLTGGDNFYNFEQQGNSYIFSCELKDLNNDNIYIIKKIYTFDDKEYIFKLNIEISNKNGIPLNFDNSGVAYSIAWQSKFQNNVINKQNRKYNYYSFFNGKKVIKVLENSDIIKKSNNRVAEIKTTGVETWLAKEDRYFTTIMLPDYQNYNYFFDYSDIETYSCGFSRITDKSILKSTFYIYNGPKLRSILKKYNNYSNENFEIKNSNLSKIVQPIMFWIGDGIGFIINIIYKIFRNYGIAIILLTIIIKLLLYPLTHKSMESQEKMTKLQPKLKELQQKYKDNPEALNRETMNLYKKEGVNPFGGCLPLLLQMPILIAMYQLLDRMVELKGAGFLWIKDLSLPDAIWTFPNNFVIPLINIGSINILPIVMVVVQVLSSLFQPEVQSNSQTKMMMWMLPLIFFFLFYNVSSGLVLYWTVMNILTLGQQLLKKYLFPKIFTKRLT